MTRPCVGLPRSSARQSPDLLRERAPDAFPVHRGASQFAIEFGYPPPQARDDGVRAAARRAADSAELHPLRSAADVSQRTGRI